MITEKISSGSGAKTGTRWMGVIVTLVLCLSLLSGCQEDSDFFPLESDLSWNYRVTILPEVEPKEFKKIVVSNLHLVTLTQSSDLGGEEVETFRLTPRLREDSSLYYYFDDQEGIRRSGLPGSTDGTGPFRNAAPLCIQIPSRRRNALADPE